MPQVDYKATLIGPIRRLVVKVGSAVLSDPEGGLRADVIDDLAGQIEAVVGAGREVVLVTSGAIAAGRARLGRKTATMAERQAAAATGQIELMRQWAKAFDARGRTVAQLLLTHQDFAEHKRRLNAIHTIQALIAAGVVPIINENDTVAVEEIRMGDNDVLSSLVAGMVQADLLIILSDVPGVLTGDPRKRADARLIPLIADPEAEMRGLVAESAGPLGSGGMATKLKAARQAARAGISVIIAPGRDGDTLACSARSRPRDRHADSARAHAAQKPQALDRLCDAPGRHPCRRPRRGRGLALERPQPARLGNSRGPRRFRERRLRQPARRRRRRVRSRTGELPGRRCTKGQGPALAGNYAPARLQGCRRNRPSRQFRTDRRARMNLEDEILAGLRAARAAAKGLALAATERKNSALEALAKALRDATPNILAANRKDLDSARSAGAGGAFLERMTLNADRVAAMARSVEEVVALPDPVGEVMAKWQRPNGLEISQVRVPLGVVAIIYESRPNVTVDAAALGFKAGNAVVLRGGREAMTTNAFLAGLIGEAVGGAGLDPNSVMFVRNPDREVIQILKRHPEADRSDNPARRQGVESRTRRFRGARPAAFRRYLPHLRRSRGRPQNGRGDLLQRQMQPSLGLQRDGNPAGPSRDRLAFLSR